MQYTLEDFLEESLIPEIQLLTKPKDFRMIVIEGASVQELPAQRFIDKNELVLTTGIGCQDEHTFLQLICELSNAAAVFIAFEKENFFVPRSVIDLADSLDLTLFRIPWRYRFAEIQTYIIEKVQGKQLGIYQDLQTDLCNLFFEGRSLHDAAAFIESVLKYPVSIYDQEYRVQGISSSMRKTNQNRAEVFKLPISTGSTEWGFLVFYAADQPSPSLMKESVLSRFLGFPLSLWFNRKNTEDMLITKMKNDFIVNLSNGNYSSFQDMVVYGRQLHFDLTIPYTCILLKVIPGDEHTSAQQYSSVAAVNTASIEAFLILAGKKQHLRVMVADRSLEFTVYVENKADDSAAQIDKFVDGLDAELKKMFPYYNFYWGISEISLRVPDYRRIYKNAAIALQHSLNSNRKRYRCNFQDTKEAQIISILSEYNEIYELVQETVGTLQNYDADSSIDLLGTLTEYIKCNYNTSKTARNLHIHRQSLLYRLEKIEELTEMRLDHHQDLFLLEVCMRILVGDSFY